MSRAKTTSEYVPSVYQRAIFDFVENGQGNAIIEAEPGAAKTTSLIWSLKYINKDAKILFTAFNNDIVEELKKKIKKENDSHNVDCKTMHSLGKAILKVNYGKEIDSTPNDFKYSSYIYNNIKALGGEVYKNLPFRDTAKYLSNIKKYVDLGRCFLVDSFEGMDYIEKHYSIKTFGNEKEIALKVMNWGKENYQTIDFTDMIWLPNVLDCKPYDKVYDWIIIDECQDTSRAERGLILKCTKPSTRMLFAGQELQMLYSFQGNSDESFNELKNLPNTISLPLSISYRCAKNIVKLANRFSPNMQACEGAPEGIVKRNVSIDEIEDGDMVLCRVNAPLLQMYAELAKRGKVAYIRGKDIGINLIKLIKKTNEKSLFSNLLEKGVFSSLYNTLFSQIDSVMKKNHISFEMALEDSDTCQLYDTIHALEAISEDCNSADCLIDKINNLFSDKKAKGIGLSTIHKAKGLECKNVFICCPSLLPAKSAKEKWELQQEINLEFVAYTRAKEKLCFLSEDGFTDYSSNSQQKASELSKKKDRVFNLYGPEGRCKAVVPNKKAAKHIIENSTKINKKSKKAIDINSKTKKSQGKKTTSIGAFKPKKIKRRIKI